MQPGFKACTERSFGFIGQSPRSVMAEPWCGCTPNMHGFNFTANYPKQDSLKKRKPIFIALPLQGLHQARHSENSHEVGHCVPWHTTQVATLNKKAGQKRAIPPGHARISTCAECAKWGLSDRLRPHLSTSKPRGLKGDVAEKPWTSKSLRHRNETRASLCGLWLT